MSIWTRRFTVGAAFVIAAAIAGPALAQTMDELLNDGKNTDNVLTMSMGMSRQNYSPLNKINKGNVKRLVPVWSTSLMNDTGELAAPVVHNGVIYTINGKWTFAIDVDTGQQIWRTPVQLEPNTPRANAALNAKAHLRKPVTVDDVLPSVRRPICSMIAWFSTGGVDPAEYA